ncbi:MAG: GLUG motif-containing protein [Phycisphaerales bacterium]
MYVARGFRGIVAIGLLLTIVSATPAKYSGGTGEPNDPYQIATAADLIALGETPGDYDKHFILTADIDLSGRKWSEAVIPRFSGTFDGNHGSIRHISIETDTSDAGLFGRLASTGQVRRLDVLDITIISSENHVGGLVGFNDGGHISGCYSTGTVGGWSFVGGLVGRNEGTVTSCCSTGLAAGNSQVGGLVGYNNTATVNSSYSAGMVHGGWSVGGLVGHNEKFCNVRDCYSISAVSGDTAVGGLVGDNYTHCDITHCYSGGTVEGGSLAGGIVGSNSGSIRNSFWDVQASGQITSDGGEGKTTAEMQDPSTFIPAGWDFVDESSNGIHEVWQFVNAAGYPLLSVFGGYVPIQLEGEGTPSSPYLIHTPADLGAAIRYDQEACYRLTADIDLSEIRWSVAVIPLFSGTFDGNGFAIRKLAIVGEDYFGVGLFGRLTANAKIQDLQVTDVTVTGSGLCVGGLSGDNAGSIIDCHVTGAVTNSGGYFAGVVGGLAGYNEGAITRCSNAGVVTGMISVGGLVGTNEGSLIESSSTAAVNGSRHYQFTGGLVGLNFGQVDRCFSLGSVTGGDEVGGLIGSNGSFVSNCYSAGAVAGGSHVGGLAGYNDGTVNTCYSTGPAAGSGWAVGVGGLVGENSGGVYLSYWDTDASGLSTSGGGRGRTTVQMKSIGTFRGWGCKHHWVLDEGRDYPHLVWENSSGMAIIDPIRVYGGGTGEPNDPYRIYTPEEFTAIGWYWPDFERCFLLMEDLDLTAIDPDRIVPIGTKGLPFTGVFDGNGRTIRNITLPFSEDNYVGLFGYVGTSGADSRRSTGTVQNVHLQDVQIAGDYCVGGLFGYCGGVATSCSVSGIVNGSTYGNIAGVGNVGGLAGCNSGAMSNCHSAGSVSSGTHCLGGLIGRNSGDVIECDSTCIVTGTSVAGDATSVGGLVGDNSDGGRVSNSHSTGSVMGGSCVGGLIGGNDEDCDGCYSTGQVTGSGYAIGGLVGLNSRGAAINCYSTGHVTGSRYVGGLLGDNYGGIVSNCHCTGVVDAIKDSAGGLVGYNNSGTVSSSYSSGAVNGTDRVGGLVGCNEYGNIAASYSDGVVSGTGSQVGGLLGFNDGSGSVTASFWDIQTSGQNGSDGGTGKTTVEMQTAKTFLEAGWDFMGETANGTEDVWWILEGKDYPRLWWELGN